MNRFLWLPVKIRTHDFLECLCAMNISQQLVRDCTNKASVLLVDDQPEYILALSELLKEDYDLQSSTCGAEALEIAAGKSPPDLILLDIQMPDMDGYEVCRRLKANDRTRGIPVVFVTSGHTHTDEEKGLNLGAVDYLTKPFNSGIVRVRVRQQIERGQMERALRRSEARYRMLFENMNAGFALHEALFDENGRPTDYRFLEMNPMFEKLTGDRAEDFIGRTTRELRPDAAEQYWIDIYGQVAATGKPLSLQHYSSEVGKHFDLYAFSPEKGRFAVFFVDVTERKRAEEAQKQLQEQMAHMQRMESIGRLAGGVAYDFNNMLSIILGHTEMMREGLEPGTPQWDDLTEIHKAARRSADLTRQLLAFACKQTVELRTVDLNETVEGMLSMLRQVVGDGVRLVWKPGHGLLTVNVDPSQLDQILANLCSNARDATGGAGTITIKTGHTVFEKDAADRPLEVAPGEYISLSVSDDGCGMDEETIAHLFEPFFTGKEMGKGTGLELASVHGAVRQNNGYIHVRSKPNQGSTFTILFPRYVKTEGAGRQDATANLTPRDHKTILLVEDNASILRMVAKILGGMGYIVLTAQDPEDALRMADTHSESIDLLMTDVVMPKMNGRELADRVRSAHPGIKRLFMSGYTADIIATEGVLDDSTHFIQKPFQVKQLEAKLREVLALSP